MRGKVWGLGSLLLAGLFVQMSVIPFLQVSTVRPDLLLVLCVLIGLVFGPREALGLGLVAGLLQDLLAGRYFGFFTVGRGLTAYVVGWVGQKVYMDHILVPVLSAFVGTLLQGFLLILILFFSGMDPGETLWGRSLWLEAGFNAVLAGALFGLVARVGRGMRADTNPLDRVASPWF